MGFWLGAINMALWLMCFAFAGVAVYMGYFAETGKDVKPLAVAAVAVGFLSLLLTVTIAEQVNQKK